MVLAPLGLWTPFAVLGIVFVLVLLALSSIIHLGVGKEPFRQRLAFSAGAIVALAIAVLPWATSLKVKAFEFRVKQTSESEWLRLAEDARRLVRASSEDGQLPSRPDNDWNRGYVRYLADSHPILRLGDFPPKLFVTEEMVGVYWGTGLIGTLAVDVSFAPSAGGPEFDGFFRRKEVSDHLAIVWE